MATTTKWTTTGKCTGTDVVQHLHQRPARTRRHSQLHLRRRLVHRVARKRLQQHRSVTHVCPEHYDHLLRHHANPSKTQVCAFHLRNREAKRELNVMWNGTRLSNTTTPVYLGVHLDRTLCYKTHIEKTKMKVNARNNIIRKLATSKWGCKASTLIHQLSRPLLLSCRIRLPCVGKVYTRAQDEPGPTRLLPNHLGLPHTNELGQCTLVGRYRSSTHQEDCCLPHGTHTPNDRRQTPTIPLPTSCKQIEVAEELHAHRHAARLVCKQQQAAALERQPDRCAILCQHGTGGSRVFASWIWRGLALLASY